MRSSKIVRTSGLVVLLVALGAASAGAQYKLGAKPTPIEEYEGLDYWQEIPALEVSERSVDLRPLFPEVGNQGQQASCTAWAVAAVASYHQGMRRGRKPNKYDLRSPAFVYNQINDGRDQGSELSQALQVLRAAGAAPEVEMPYDPADYTSAPSAAAMVEARHESLMYYARLADADQIRLALSLYMPVVVAIQTSPIFIEQSRTWQVYDQALFEKGERLWQERAANSELSVEDVRHQLHAVVLVGYDDERRAFLMMNSWGTEWGQRGFAWLSYDLFERIVPTEGTFAREAYVAKNRRGFHPRAKRMVGADSDWLDLGYDVDGLVWTRDEGGWAWKVWIEDWEESFDPIERVVWTVRDGARETTVTRSEPPFLLEEALFKPGLVDLTATLYFDDGTTGTADHRIPILHVVPRTARINHDTDYWGVDTISDGRRVPLWHWRANLRRAKLDVRRVVWRLPADFDHPVRTETDPARGFDIEGYAERDFKISAVVYPREGAPRTLQSVVELFDERRDQLAVLVQTNTLEAANGNWSLSFSVKIDGPLMERRHLTRVVYELDDDLGGPADQRATPDQSFWLEREEFLFKRPPREVRVTAELFFDDRPPQRLSGVGTVYYPVDE